MLSEADIFENVRAYSIVRSQDGSRVRPIFKLCECFPDAAKWEGFHESSAGAHYCKLCIRWVNGCDQWKMHITQNKHKLRKQRWFEKEEEFGRMENEEENVCLGFEVVDASWASPTKGKICPKGYMDHAALVEAAYRPQETTQFTQIIDTPLHAQPGRKPRKTVTFATSESGGCEIPFYDRFFRRRVEIQ